MRRRKDLSTYSAPVTGSIQEVHQTTGKPLDMIIAEDVKVVVLIDISTSMLNNMSGSFEPYDPYDEGKKRGSKYDKAVVELEKIQAAHPGQVLVIAFSDTVQVCLTGRPPTPIGMTQMARALDELLDYDDMGYQLIILADGSPTITHEPRQSPWDIDDDADTQTMKVARKFVDPLNCIYIGPPKEEGADFMKLLAGLNTGSFTTTSKDIKQLAAPIEKLLQLMARN